jgi:hypothetical protein
MNLIHLICFKSHIAKGMSTFLQVFTWEVDALIKHKDS